MTAGETEREAAKMQQNDILVMAQRLGLKHRKLEHSKWSSRASNAGALAWNLGARVKGKACDPRRLEPWNSDFK